jgi:hypothetical protein
MKKVFVILVCLLFAMTVAAHAAVSMRAGTLSLGAFYGGTRDNPIAHDINIPVIITNSNTTPITYSISVARDGSRAVWDPAAHDSPSYWSNGTVPAGASRTHNAVLRYAHNSSPDTAIALRAIICWGPEAEHATSIVINTTERALHTLILMRAPLILYVPRSR